ncbi:MAG: hypothetical protein APR56_08495 [Methanosaeta sp. SDB]|nr:MAG: hypothetical protein APR56_08495 [Methanosaeta sp. SDB]
MQFQIESFWIIALFFVDNYMSICDKIYFISMFIKESSRLAYRMFSTIMVSTDASYRRYCKDLLIMNSH